MRCKQGQSLIEVILVTFLFGVLGTGLLTTLLSSSFVSSRGVEYSLGNGYIQEAIQAVRSVRDRQWSELTNGTHGLTNNSGFYELAGTADSLDGGRFTRTITVEDVYRTAALTGDIAETGFLDAASKKITVNVTWEVPAGLIKNIDTVFYVYNWDQESWVQTLTSDFENGSQNSSQIATVENGEVTLRRHNTDWNEIEIFHELALVGGDDRTVMYADPDADILYVLGDDTGGDNFHALDISDVSSTTPTMIESYSMSQTKDFVVQNGYVYFASDEDGPGAEITILQVPSMAPVATINLPGTSAAQGLDLYHQTLVIARAINDPEDELLFYDISDPMNPLLLGGVDTGVSLNDVVFNGTYAYAVTNDDTQEVIAIRQSDYSIIDTVDLPGSSDAGAVDLFGSQVYIGKDSNSSGSELYSINALDPTNLTITSSLEVAASVEHLQVDVSGAYLAAATRLDGKNFFVVDLSSFTETHSGDLSGGAQSESGSLFGSHGYLGSTSAPDVTVFRVSPGGWGDAELVSTADLSGNHDESSIWISGNYAYQGTENNGVNHDFFIYDISTPTSPTYLGSIDTNSDVSDLIVSGNYVYLATKDNAREVIVIDATTKTSPQIVGNFNAAGSRDGVSITLSGTTLYLGRDDGSDSDFYVLSLSNPAAPAFVGSTQYTGDLERMVVNGLYVYAATDVDTEELAVFDVSNPAMPSKVAGLNLSDDEDGQALAISDTLLALGRAEGGGPELAIVNVAIPTTPQLLGSVDIDDEVNGVAFEGNAFIHVAGDSWQAQYQRWNITDPSLPTLDAAFDFNDGNDGEGIFFNGVYAFVASEDNSAELNIIGPGTPPDDYTKEGNFTSQPFDAGSDVSWDSLEWTFSGTGSVSFRIRSADTQANLTTARWVGSDGTSESSLTVWGQNIITDPSATGERWFQWKASLTGNGNTTPSLEDVTIRYSQ